MNPTTLKARSFQVAGGCAATLGQSRGLSQGDDDDDDDSDGYIYHYLSIRPFGRIWPWIQSSSQC